MKINKRWAKCHDLRQYNEAPKMSNLKKMHKFLMLGFQNSFFFLIVFVFNNYGEKNTFSGFTVFAEIICFYRVKQ